MAEAPEPQDEELFSELMRQYDQIDEQLAEVDIRKKELDEAKKHVRALLKDCVENMGLGPGATLPIDGLGKFSFTTQRYYHCPADRRQDFVGYLIERGEEAVLSVGKSDLNQWAEDMKQTEQAVPPYITFHEDRFVPRISLEASKVRRQKS